MLISKIKGAFLLYDWKVASYETFINFTASVCSVTHNSMLVFSTSCLQVLWKNRCYKIKATNNHNTAQYGYSTWEYEYKSHCWTCWRLLHWSELPSQCAMRTNKVHNVVEKRAAVVPEQHLNCKVGAIAATPQKDKKKYDPSRRWSHWLQQDREVNISQYRSNLLTLVFLFVSVLLGCRGFAPCDKEKPPT